MRQAVLRDLAAAHEHHPRVSDQFGPGERDREQRDDGDGAHGQSVRLQGGQDPRAAIDGEGDDDRSFDAFAIGTGSERFLPRMGRPGVFKTGLHEADIAGDALIPA